MSIIKEYQPLFISRAKLNLGPNTCPYIYNLMKCRHHFQLFLQFLNVIMKPSKNSFCNKHGSSLLHWDLITCYTEQMAHLWIWKIKRIFFENSLLWVSFLYLYLENCHFSCAEYNLFTLIKSLFLWHAWLVNDRSALLICDCTYTVEYICILCFNNSYLTWIIISTWWLKMDHSNPHGLSPE